MDVSRTNFNIEKLRGSSNYHTWKFAMVNLLEMQELIDCLEDGKEKDHKKVTKAKNYIILHMDASLYDHVAKYDKPYEVWEALERLYDDKGLSRKIGLLRSLISVRLESCSGMQEYVDSIIATANKLKNIGFDLTDEWLASILLAGLTEEYKPLIMGLEASSKNLSSDDVVGKLIDNAINSTSSSSAFVGKKKMTNKVKKCYRCGSPKHLANKCNEKKT